MKTLLLFVLVINQCFAFDWQGHRGARGLYPENTINGMKMDLDYPITTLEMDVVVTKDKRVVVSHDPFINPEICRTSEVKKIYELTYEQVRGYDCGSVKLERFPKQRKVVENKPLLSDLIDQLEIEMKKRGKKLHYNIEIKSSVDEEKNGFQPDIKTLTDNVLTIVAERLYADRFTIQSFDWRVLKYIHFKLPMISLSALRETPYKADEVIKELGFVPQVFSPDYNLLKPSDVEFFHSKNVKVIPWTVNELATIKKLVDMKVDGIITDYPDLVSTYLNIAPTDISQKCSVKESFFEGKCIHIPAHALASTKNPGWVCDQGYIQKRNSCIKVKLPDHAVFNEDGKTWTCTEGFERYRDSCRKK